ncbi:hypothetical protein F4802DRAFT_328767 [Xylaria palmicola]|nr:hypothetical protein F4802DRAFT_328767 [Xylaria palmicola]
MPYTRRGGLNRELADDVARRARPMTGSHARKGPDISVCIACQTLCANNASLCEHGKTKKHSPYGCICGGTFTCLYGLERHIASMNKVPKVLCSLCTCDEAARTFSRKDHLLQHLKSFHRIPSGKIPKDLFVDLAQDGPIKDANPAQPASTAGTFPLQRDLDQHMAPMHPASPNGMANQPGPTDPYAPWTGSAGYPQDITYLLSTQMFSPEAQQASFFQPATGRNFQADGRFMEPMFTDNLNFNVHDQFQTGFSHGN